MLIAIDIGNSSINIGYFTRKGLLVQKISTYPLRSVRAYKSIFNIFLAKNNIEKSGFNVIISSVVLSHTAVLIDTFKQLSNKKDIDILTVNHKMNTGLKMKINHPEKLGSDRIANAAGAYGLHRSPVAVVDFGTATTITVIDNEGCYIGGSIMPGIGLMNDMLDKGTSKLKKISLRPPVSALGKDTSQCISSGLFFGSAGAVERILNEIEQKSKCRFKTVVTGGYGQMMDRFIKKPHDLNPNLIFEGLKKIYEKNRPA